MNYIGSKYRLSAFIDRSVRTVAGKDLSDKVFCDLFAGTGIVGRHFKNSVRQVISNDLEYYSYVLNRNYIGNHKPLEYESLIAELNALVGVEGFIFHEYSENGRAGRLYFSDYNGKKIDAIRQKMARWKKTRRISEDQYFFLLASLLECADSLANTASVYGAYLKKIKKSAGKKLELKPSLFELNDHPHQVFNQDSNVLIKKIAGDILYLDPPYNARQYGANYHLLNTIAQYDSFVPAGKTGLRDYNRSAYCSQSSVRQSFESLIDDARFQYIFLSYNNEGLMSADDIRSIMSRYGRYDLLTQEYQRFKADKEANRHHKASATTEYLHILEKS